MRAQEDAQQHPSPTADGFEYWSRTLNGKPYRVHMRRPRGSAAEGEVILDINDVASRLTTAQQSQCAVSEVATCPSFNL